MKILRKTFGMLCVIWAVVSVVQCVRMDRSGHPFPVSFHLVPAGMLCVVYLILRARTNPRWLCGLGVAILCAAAFAFWGLFTITIESINQATTEVTNVRKYEKILRYWRPEKPDSIVGHFPDSIPANATTVSFSYFPKFLQGGAHIQLRLALSEATIEGLYKKSSARKIKSFFGGDKLEHMKMKEGIPTTYFFTGDANDLSFPDDYEVMPFKKGKKNWHHSNSHGVAISKQRREIVYWAESW